MTAPPSNGCGCPSRRSNGPRSWSSRCDGDEDVLEYRLDGEARFGDGYICSYCGRLCAQKEPHTAAHGVAGHTHAGVPAGQDQEPPPMTGPVELGHPGSGTQL